MVRLRHMTKDINRWWLTEPDERFWLEVTDRETIGSDLCAPTTDRAGKPNWRYGLVAETQPGDVVYHFDKKVRAIVGCSEVAGPPEPAKLSWVARGTYARRDGATEEEKEAIRVPLRDYALLDRSVSRETLRSLSPKLAAAEALLRKRHKGALYFPFFVSVKRGGDVNQAYLLKLPADLVTLLGLGRGELSASTDNPKVLDAKVRRLLGRERLEPPVGQQTPRRGKRTIGTFYRSPKVIAYVLQEANGVCELCRRPAPFVDAAGIPFLEVHHVRTLAEGGSDKSSNAVALCPNCHRACHSSVEREILIASLFAKVARLVRE